MQARTTLYDRFDQALVGKHKQVGDLHPAMIVLCVTDRSFNPQSLLEAIVERAFANPLYEWISLLAVYSGRFSYRADESDPELHVRANHRAKRPVPEKFHHALAGRIVIRDGMMVVRESNADFNNGSNYPIRR